MFFRKAILIIHGFAGGTYDEEDLANYLELNKFFDVYQFTLPGHDKNLSNAKYQEWIDYSEEKLKFLIDNGYRNIYLIGHSMGGVIAAYLATKYDRVKKVVLAAPAFQYLSVINEKVNVKKSLQLTPKVIKTYGADEVVSRMLKLNLSTIKEFMELVKDKYDSPKDLKCPILLIQGKCDNLVPLTSSKYVYDSVKSKEKKLIIFDDLTHDIFRSNHNLEIYDIVERFLKYGTNTGIEYK